MRRALLLGRFLAAACLAAWVLFVPLASAGALYGRALRAGSNLALRGVGTTVSVEIKARETERKLRPEGRKDSVIVVKRPPRGGLKRPFSTWFTGYLPTVCGTALALATPIALRRRLRAAVLVALSTQLYVAARMALLVTQMLLDDPALHAELPSFLSKPFVHDLLGRLTDLDREASLYLLIPLGLWAAVALRVDDLQRLWYGAAATASEGDEPSGPDRS